MNAVTDSLNTAPGQLDQPSVQIIVAGVGGQGTVLASRILAEAALLSGYPLRSAETIGMAQRGGSVLGHLRIMPAAKLSEMPFASPLVPRQSADMLIGFELAEALRALDYLRPGKTAIVAKQALRPAAAVTGTPAYDGAASLKALQKAQETGRIGQLCLIDTASIGQRLGNAKAQNVVLLGAAAALGVLPFDEQTLTAALTSQIKPKYLSVNLQAFAAGQAAATEELK